ncbi:MAG: glycosyl hydrolase repeat-containing protein, partial [Acidobacteria bacterium]|nr:glycosyl hydrolase repeat-containing protein [Acidobacteriota bacterium]
MNGMVKSRWIVALCTGLVTVVTAGTVVAQPATQAASTPKTVVSATAADPNQVVDPRLFGGLQYRSLGFSRGGRSTTVAGVPSQPLTFYFGATGGGVWKTINAGLTWQNVSDGFFEAGSIGAIDVAQSDPNVIYVGTGSACPRGNISPGVGVYKSTDAGKTWTHVGLRDAGQVGRVRIHP